MGDPTAPVKGGVLEPWRWPPCTSCCWETGGTPAAGRNKSKSLSDLGRFNRIKRDQIRSWWPRDEALFQSRRINLFQKWRRVVAHCQLTFNSMTFKGNKTKSSQYTCGIFDYDLEMKSVVPVFKLKSCLLLTHHPVRRLSACSGTILASVAVRAS